MLAAASWRAESGGAFRSQGRSPSATTGRDLLERLTVAAERRLALSPLVPPQPDVPVASSRRALGQPGSSARARNLGGPGSARLAPLDGSVRWLGLSPVVRGSVLPGTAPAAALLASRPASDGPRAGRGAGKRASRGAVASAGLVAESAAAAHGAAWRGGEALLADLAAHEGVLRSRGIGIPAADRLRVLRVLSRAGELGLVPLSANWLAAVQDAASGRDAISALSAVCEACFVQGVPERALPLWTALARACDADAADSAQGSRPTAALSPMAWEALLRAAVDTKQWRAAASILHHARLAATGAADRGRRAAAKAWLPNGAARTSRAAMAEALLSTQFVTDAVATAAAMRDWPAGVDAVLAACASAAELRRGSPIRRTKATSSAARASIRAAALAMDSWLDSLSRAGAPASAIGRVVDRACPSLGYEPHPRHAVVAAAALASTESAQLLAGPERVVLACAGRHGAAVLQSHAPPARAIITGRLALAAPSHGAVATAASRRAVLAAARSAVAGLTEEISPTRLSTQRAAGAASAAGRAAACGWASSSLLGFADLGTLPQAAPRLSGGSQEPAVVQSAGGVVSALIRGATAGLMAAPVEPAILEQLRAPPSQKERPSHRTRLETALYPTGDDSSGVAFVGGDEDFGRATWGAALGAWWAQQARAALTAAPLADSPTDEDAAPHGARIHGTGASDPVLDVHKVLSQSWYDSEASLVVARSRSER